MSIITPEDLLDNLNDEQAEAVVQTDGPVLILAGAGSGKTRVITYRIAYLLEKGLARPSEILAVTFTNKAAGEMRQRVEDTMGRPLRALWILTFHAMGARFLRKHAELLNRTPSFIIYDQDDTERLAKQCMKECNIDPKRLSPASFTSWLNDQKLNLLLHPDKVATGFIDRTYIKIWERYKDRLSEANAFDFSDLICRPVEVLERFPDVRQEYQNRWRYILVDEYQDTNHAQYVLLKHLTGGVGNICVVGDDDQSIYGWRGADIRNILEFEQDFGSSEHPIHTCHLTRNYRSPKVILDAANALITHNEGRRKEKGLWTDRVVDKKILYYNAPSGPAEADFVSQIINRAVQREGRNWSDFAVFYRTHSQSRLIEQALMRCAIPYKIFGGTKFFARKEVKDLLAYLRVLANPLDEVSLFRIINLPRRGIGNKTMNDLIGMARKNLVSPYVLLEDPPFAKGTKAKLKNFYNFIEELRAETMDLSPRTILETVIEKIDYMAHLEHEGREDRIEVVKELVSHAAEFERQHEAPSLETFLEDVALVSPTDNLDSNAGTVTMMTMHNAKGLEFPYVFIVGMEEGLFPHNNSLDDPTRLEEERRLCYVGITRTEERLFLTGARQRLMYGRMIYNLPSRFLREINPDCMEIVRG